MSLLTVSAAQGTYFLTSPSWIWATIWGGAAVTLAWVGTRATRRIVHV